MRSPQTHGHWRFSRISLNVSCRDGLVRVWLPHDISECANAAQSGAGARPEASEVRKTIPLKFNYTT